MQAVSITPTRVVNYEIDGLSLLDSVKVQLDDSLIERVKKHTAEAIDLNCMLRKLYMDNK
jgi:hypothetical protein